jgi:Zn-dependent protease
MASWYLSVGRIAGFQVRLHVALPIGALIVSSGRIAPVFWAAYGFLILAHELGHAFLVRRYRLRVLSIDLHPLGGECRYEGPATPLQDSKIAWGGVLAQAAVLIAADRLLKFFPSLGEGPLASSVFEVLLAVNLYLIVLNLLPFGRFDGREAWQLLRLWKIAGWPRQLWLRLRLFVVKRRLDRVQRQNWN